MDWLCCIIYVDQAHDINHILGMDTQRQKQSSALFILKMKETHRLSQVAVNDIVEGSRDVFNHAVGRLHAGVRSKLAILGIDETTLDGVFTTLNDPLETQHLQEKCFKEDLNLVVCSSLSHIASYYIITFCLLEEVLYKALAIVPSVEGLYMTQS